VAAAAAATAERPAVVAAVTGRRVAVEVAGVAGTADAVFADSAAGTADVVAAVAVTVAVHVLRHSTASPPLFSGVYSFPCVR